MVDSIKSYITHLKNYLTILVYLFIYLFRAIQFHLHQISVQIQTTNFLITILSFEAKFLARIFYSNILHQ